QLFLYTATPTTNIYTLSLHDALPILGREFMPPLDEGSLLFMPVTLPDVSNSEVKRILQVQDKIIKTVPEVKNVLGKAGRANTATDRKSTRLNSSHDQISYAVFCLKKK